MALFQKKVLPVTVPKYTLGHQEVKLIVGLGNPGKEYENTPHNVGFNAIDYYAKSEGFNPWVEKKDLQAILCAKIIDGKKVILCKPTTYMNESGRAVQMVQHFYKISEHDTCVIYDELALDLGIIRSSEPGGRDAGHNGIKSLAAHTENSFWRIRIGTGPLPGRISAKSYVLKHFSDEQEMLARKAVKEVAGLLNDWLAGSAKAETRSINSPK